MRPLAAAPRPNAEARAPARSTIAPLAAQRVVNHRLGPFPKHKRHFRRNRVFTFHPREAKNTPGQASRF